MVDSDHRPPERAARFFGPLDRFFYFLVNSKVVLFLASRFDDPAVEQAYMEEHLEKSMLRFRHGLLVGGILYAAFGLLDLRLIPDAVLAAWIVRYGVILPFSLGLIRLSYTKYARRWLERGILLAGFASGLGIVLMIALADPPGNYLYYAGLLLTCTYFAATLQLRFWPTTALCWIIFLAYEIVAIGVNPIPTSILLNDTFFFISFNVISMGASFSIEKYRRADFAQRCTIQQQAEQMKAIMREIEQERNQAEEISKLDPLTNLFNRRHFYFTAEQICGKIKRGTVANLGLIMIDLDHFKTINDTLGHPCGDTVLIAVARQIQNRTRQTDLACRFGGEEFAILLPDIEGPAAAEVAARLNDSIRRLAIATEKGETRVAASMGVATFHRNDPIDIQLLIDRADQALYQAKQAGRDQVKLWQPAEMPLKP